MNEDLFSREYVSDSGIYEVTVGENSSSVSKTLFTYDSKYYSENKATLEVITGKIQNVKIN
jgi:hypothetical protein